MRGIPAVGLFATGCVLLPLAGSALAAEPVLYPGERLVPITLPADGHLAKSGWTRGGKAVAYRLKVAAGSQMTINMTASSKRFTYLVIFDMNDPDPEDAIYSSDTRKLPAHIFADTADMDLLIRPFFAKQAPRRGLGSHFDLDIVKTR